MKYLYIALNILFISVIVIASRSYFASTDDNLISKTKKSKPSTTHSVKTKQNPSVKTVSQLNANIAVQHNLFNPNRGGSANKQTGNKPSSRNNHVAQKFKLVGVYRFGKNHGAIIISSNQSRRSRSSRRNRNNPPPTTSKVKRFYRMGDVLDNGFILKKVETRTVVLSKGSESITLEIEHNNPTIRESSKPKNSAKRVSMKVSRPTYNMPEQMIRPLPTLMN